MSETRVAARPLRVAIIGTAARAMYMYARLLPVLADEVALVSVWGRSDASAQRLGESLGVPWYTDLDRLVRETAPEIGIVCVSGKANDEVGLAAVQAGLNVLLETPIANDLSVADAIIETAARNGTEIEVSEQFHRRPLEALKLRLIASGLFGTVHSSFNDFGGHGYHGVSLMRSYLGFDAVPVRVTGAVRDYQLAPQWSRIHDTTDARTETQEHGIVDFADGRLGIFHWTSVGYDSPLRWWRSSRFLAQNGMGISVGVGLDVREQLSLLAPGGEAPLFITIERRWERVDGGALVAMIAHTGDADLPIVRWDNPFESALQRHGAQWHDDEIGVAGCLMSLVHAIRNDTEPTYGPVQARLDQEIILAIRESAANGGSPVTLPMARGHRPHA
jgi:predicted dehydrogenase